MTSWRRALNSVKFRPRLITAIGLGGTYLHSRWSSSQLEASGKSVVITGCDTGLGHALAVELDKLGMEVYACCLDVSSTGAQNLQRNATGTMKLLQLDVRNEADVSNARHAIEEGLNGEGLWGLVNNAGVCYLADVELTPPGVARKMTDINLHGAVSVTQSLLPHIRRRGGRVVNMSSLTGKIPMEGYGMYAASKAALEAFSDVLRLEMSKWNVKVSVIEPAGFKTDAVRGEVVAARKAEISEVMDECIKQQYGQRHLDILYANFEKSVPAYPEDYTPVVEAVKGALLARHPRARYQAGRGAASLYRLCHVLPQTVADILILNLGFGVRKSDMKAEVRPSK